MKETILVVDDEPTVRETLTRFLEERDYDVHTAVDGQEAIEKIAEVGPDVVLLDIRMPRMNGTEVLEHLRDEGIDVGVIMISGQGDEGVARETLELGAADYITKPFDLEYLELSLVAKLLTLGP